MPRPNSQARKRPWDRALLSRFRQAAAGDSIAFELLAGEMASGTIGYLGRTNGELIYLSGTLATPEGGRFFFQKQTRLGVAGEVVGVVEFPGAERAHRIEPTGPDGKPELIERDLDEVLCLRLPVPDGAATN